MLSILKKDVTPALIYTEPVALLIAIPQVYGSIKGILGIANIKLSLNIYKKGIGVGIIGTLEMGLFLRPNIKLKNR